jgi:ribosomal protein S18 acetylase RimI-like enzyme
MFKELKLPKTGDTASVALLTPDDLPDVLNLQDETRAALPTGQKMFVLPQPSAYFQSLLNRDTGFMVGIRVDGKLVAQMAMMGALTLDEMTEQQKLTRNDVAFHHADASESVVIAKSMAVHPDWRGNELSQSMLEAALSAPLARTADHVFAQVSVDNVRSWDLFLRQGFGIVAAAIDPADQKPRFILQKPALGFALHHMQSAEAVDAAADFAAIMRLTQREALIGKLDRGAGFKLAFYASAEMAASWHDAPASLA